MSASPKVRPSMKRITVMPGSTCTTSGDRPASKAARDAARSRSRKT